MNKQNQMVYNKISKEFNDTRWIPWPCTQIFLKEQKPYSIGCEAGCGNGRNILYRDDLTMFGFDFCENFCKIVNKKGGEVMKSDIRSAPFKNDIFDFVISIAVIHHLDKYDDRLKAIQEMTRITKKNGKIFILVWAFEQEKNYRRKFTKQDELVSWKSKDGKTFFRFYHLFKKNELKNMILSIPNLSIIRSFKERGNYGIICQKN